MYFAAPGIYTLLKMNPRYRRPSVMIGFFIILAALTGASFCNSIGSLIATQGFLYAVGGSLHYYPVLLYLDEWFIQRRGFAFGIICAGAGAGGVAIPLTMDWILRNWGFRTALRAWAVIFVVLTTPALWYMKPRLPVRHHSNSGPQRVEIGYLKSSTFWILIVANIVQGLGYFMPSIYLSSFAQAVGFSAVNGTLAICLINLAQMAGAMFIGFLCDRYHVTTAILVCSIGTVVAVFAFWTFATFQPMLYIFAILYGIYAGGYSTTWSGIANTVRESGYPGTETGMIIAWFSCSKGIGAVISGPLSEALVAADHWKSRAPYAFGSGYGTLIITTGVTALVAGSGFYAKKLRFIK